MEDNINVHCYGSEPLSVVRRTDIPTNDLKADVAKIYAEIDKCTSDIVVARGKRDDKGIADAHLDIESVMVKAQQLLTKINNYLI